MYVLYKRALLTSLFVQRAWEHALDKHTRLLVTGQLNEGTVWLRNFTFTKFGIPKFAPHFFLSRRRCRWSTAYPGEQGLEASRSPEAIDMDDAVSCLPIFYPSIFSMIEDSCDARRNGEGGLLDAACVAPKRISRALTRQLTFVDVERSVTMSGENGSLNEYDDAENNSNGNGTVAHGNGFVNGGNSEDNRKVAIVTGATSGIGLALAQHLHRTQNYRIALVGRNFDKGIHVSSPFNDPSAAQFFQCDVGSYESQKEMFLSVWKTWGQIDLCCLNAGNGDIGDVDNCRKDGESGRTVQKEGVGDMPAEPELSDTEACYRELIYGVRLAMHFMQFNPRTLLSGDLDAPRGKVIVNASIGGAVSCPSYSSAVIQFVKGMAESCKRKEGVWVNCVSSETVAAQTMPQECVEGVSEECLRPFSTVIAAYDVFINDKTGEVGKVLEALADNLCWYELPEPSNADRLLSSI
ncbi:hypothetical protein CERZMDRAFT_83125 [Cercospora zeae-maydis SCOH1-5]|uniref:Uncharacterized protein n=1 Tax=Cercospora zeae-maydis SCOH1-5 TaxID=717836 RepID=A0A6A6FMA2_9PEZI|nr:hypothetical protein CERZMDRAFT_83125 [Cercospora zeae-maydis SCOH1-5]